MSDLKIQGVVEVSTDGVESSLNRVGTAAENMSRKVETSADKAGKAIDSIGDGAQASVENFTREEGKLYKAALRSTRQLELLGKTASQKLEMNISAKGLDAAKFEPVLSRMRELEAAQARVGVGSRGMGSQLQNTSYQLQDFIVQVNGGTDATRALSMQLPQMLVGFGAAGAAIGVVAALLPNLIQAFGSAGESSKKFSDAMSDFDKAIGDVGSTVKAFDMDKLYEQFNQSSDAVRNATIEQLRFQQEYIKTTQLVASKKFGESLGGFGEYSTLDKLAGSFAGSGANKLATQLGVSVETAKDLLPVLRGLKSGSEDVNLAFNRFGTALLGGNSKAVELAQTMATLSKSERDAAAASSALSDAQDKMAKGHVTTKKEAEDAAKARKESAKAAEAEAKALETLLDSINGKSADFDSNYVKNVETLLTAYDKGKLSLSGFNEVFSRYVAMQPGAIAAAKELAKAEESRSKYLASVEDETEKLVEKAKASEYELSLIGKSADEIERLTAARYDEKIELLQDKIAAIESLEGRNAEVEAIERQIDALQRLKSAEIVKPKLQAQAREWENFARDIERSLTDALYRSFESGGSIADNFAKTLENTIKTALAKALIQATMTTSANALNGIINAIAGTSGENGGAGGNYFGLANNANSVYNLGSAAVNTYGALTTGAGAISGTATLANMYGAAGGDSLGAFIAMNPQWASAASSAGAAAGAEAGAAAGSASASASSAASYAGYAAALYQAYKGDYASASLTATGTYIGSMFGPWGAAIGALVGTLVGSFIQPGGGPKDNNRYSYSEGNYERLSGGSAGVLKDYSASAADQINGLAAMYGNDTRIAGREAWLSLDPRGTASTQLNLELFDQIGRKLYSRMDEYGGNIENVGRSSASLQENMARTMRDAVLLAVARADIGDAVTVALFDQFESGIKDLSATQGDMVIGALKMGWLDDVLGVVDEAQIGLSGVADAVANLMSIVPMKKVFDDLGVSIFDIGAQTEQTLPALANLKKTITGADGSQVTETFRETYLRTVNEFVAVANMLDAMGLKVSEAFKMSDVNNVLSMSDALVQLFGTVEDMSKSFNAYYENFYSAAEKSARSWELMQRSFDGLGLAMPKTREGFRDLVEGLDLNTTAGVQTFKALMDLQSAFSALTPSVDDLATSTASVDDLASTAASAADRAKDEFASLIDLNLSAAQSAADGALQALQSSISAESAAINDAKNAAIARYAEEKQAQLDALQVALDGYSQQRTAAQQVARELTNLQRGLISAQQSASVPMSYQAGQAEILQALDAAKSTGSLPTLDELSDALSAVRAPNANSYRSAADMAIDQARTASALGSLGDIAGSQASLAQQTVNRLDALIGTQEALRKQIEDQYAASVKMAKTAAQDQIDHLQDIFDNAKNQLDALNGITSATYSVEDAVLALNEAMSGLSLAKSDDSNGIYRSAAGATYNQSSDTWKMLGGTGNAGTAQVQKFIADTLSRADGQMTLYTAAKTAGISLADVNRLAGWADGTAEEWARQHKLPIFDVGTNRVPQDTLAFVHQNEAIIPAAFNPWANGGAGNNSANLERLVESLTAEVKRLQGLVNEGNQHARRTADATNGNPERIPLVEVK